MAAGVGVDAVSCIVSEAAKSLFQKIKQEISYVFKYQSNIDSLNKQVKELGYRREMVEQPVNHAKRQGDEIYTGVEDWLNRVDDFIKKDAKRITGDEDEAKKGCLKGLCPNLFERYNLSKKAMKAVQEGDDLLGRGDFSTVSYRPAPDGTELRHVKGYEQFDSRKEVFQQLMEALKDNKFNIIGVYGMGGVGKTTLVKQVAKQVMEDKLFDMVVMAEVTQTPDRMAIQSKIANELGITFDPNESELDRAAHLRRSFKNKKRVLVVLDNIWKKLELHDVGIPFQNDEKERKDEQGRCTIILTSRNQDLLRNEMNTKKDFSIEVLSDKEAEQLFEKIVGDSAKQSDFQPTAYEVVRRCGGLPVALSTIASALKNKRLAIWKDVLHQLRSSNRKEIHGMDANVYSSIELSYNYLESAEAKSLFLLCGLFSEGRPIKVPYLVRYGMGLGLFENVYTLEAGRNRVDTLIDSLKTSCLLLDGDAEDEVKMHDIIHVVAVSIAQKGPTTISLPYKDVYEIPELSECPQLRLLLLFTKDGSSGPIPDLFFNEMKELKVLHLAGIDCLPSLPSSLGCLINLQTLCLDGCRLEDITTVGQLKGLKILSFQDSNIKHLPLEIGHLTRLQLLDLRNCRSLEVIAPNVIASLSRLEELYIDDRFTGWEKAEGGENASLFELRGLSKLTTLELHIPNAEIILQDLVSVELERFKIFIGNVFGWLHWYDIYETSRVMKLGGIEKSILLGNYRKKILLKSTESLYLEELKGFENVVHELDDEEGFSRLKHFHVKDCFEILHIVSSVGQVHSKVFPLLESLFLHSLNNLEKVCQGQLTEDQSFSNLRIIKVKECVRLKHLFSFSMAKNLLRLRKVELFDCKNMKMIVGPDMEKPTTTFKEIIAEDDAHEKVIFPSLEELTLYSLPELTSFAVGIKSVEFPSLLKVDIWNCHNLKRFTSISTSEENTQPLFDEKVWDDHLATNSLSKLKELKIFESSKVRSIFPPTGRLPNLEVLSIKFIHNLTQIWHNQLTSDSWSKLKELNISNCGGLTSIFPPMVAMPNLMTLRVSRCHGLRSLMTLSTAQSMVNLTTLDISYCEKMEEIIEEQVGEEKLKEDRMVFTFSQLKYLTLDYLQSLTCFCLGNYALEFSSLEEVRVRECQNMKTFSEGVRLATPKLYGVVYFYKKYGEYPGDEKHWEGNLNSTIQKMFKEMVGFRHIKDLKLSRFPHLKEIWHSQALPVNFFDNLLTLTVDGCTDMLIAISANLLRCLNKLIWLTVSNCDSLEEVFHLEELNVDEHSGPLIFPPLLWLELINLPKLQRLCNFTGNIIELPSLYFLTIENCPNMEAFISNSTSVHMTANKEHPEMTSEENFLPTNIQSFFDENQVVFPRLETLKLSRLPKLLHLWKDNSQPRKAFQNLKTLEISKCDGLIKIATILTAESLVKLKRMKINDCKTIQEIIQVLGEEEKKDCIVFKNLEYLRLDCLPSLTSFCLGNYTFEFPSLKRVLVRECLNMMTFSHGVLYTPKLHKVQVKGEGEGEGEGEEEGEEEEGDDDDDYDDEGDDDEGRWEGDLNSTIKQLFKDMLIESLPSMVAGVWSTDDNMQLEATTRFRKLLSSERNPQIEEVIRCGVVQRFVVFLMREDFPQLQFEAAWALKNIASGTSENAKVVIDSGAIPIFVKLLASPSDDVREQVVWALGNVAVHSSRWRDFVLSEGALIPLLAQLNEHAKPSLLRISTLTLSNFFEGKPQPPFDQVRLALQALARLIHSNDEEVLIYTCRALSYLFDGTNDKIQAVIKAGVCPRLVELLGHPSPSVLIPALQTVGNIVRGDDFQTQAVIDAGLIGPLVNLLQDDDFDIKGMAAWAISNVTSGGTHEQIKYLVSKGCIKPLCDLSVCSYPRIVLFCLKGIENILKVGEAEKNMGTAAGEVNKYAKLVEEAEGLEKIEILQNHDINEINEKAIKILQTYWLEKE